MENSKHFVKPGSLGGAIAKALASFGARVFLTGRTTSSLQKVANEILASGGQAEVDEVDALDEKAINSHLEKVVQQAGTVDISFNATGTAVVQNIPLRTMSMEDFINPLTLMMQTRFLTAIAAGKIMMKQGSGVTVDVTCGTTAGLNYRVAPVTDQRTGQTLAS